MASEEAQWLRQYAANRCDQAFERLVSRYVDLVYSSARRQVRDDDLARDVTQAVFMILAEKAAGLDATRPLSAWLMLVTRYASANAVRARARRTLHEQRAAEMTREAKLTDESPWEAMSPLLDEGLSRLRSGDRDVLLLRFFEKKSSREVAQAMGISEDAAEKRVSRAVDRLRDFFRRRGVAVSSAVLTVGLAAHAADAAPVGLSAGILSSGSTAAATVAKGTVIAMAAAKTKALLVSVALVLLALAGGGAALSLIMTGPTTRTLTVPTETTALAAIPPSPWRVQFSDGSTTELIGVTDQSLRPAQWWKPDGSPMPAPNPPPRNILRANLAPGQRQYQFLFRQSGQQLATKTLVVSFDAQTTAGAESITGEGADRRVNVVSVMPEARSVNMILSFAAGEWEASERYDIPATAQPVATTSPAAAPANRSLEIAEITESTVANRPQTTIAVRQLQPALWKARDVRIRASTRDGRSIFPVSNTGLITGVSEYDFSASRDRIIALTFSHRPFETCEIRDIALRPGIKTQPAVVPTTQP